MAWFLRVALRASSDWTVAKQKGRQTMLGNAENAGYKLGQSGIQPQVGMPIYDCNGAKLGSVSHYDGQQPYFVMQQGLIFRRDVYVPLDAVYGTHADGIQLNVSKEDLRTVKWDQPPTGATISTPADLDAAAPTAVDPNLPHSAPLGTPPDTVPGTPPSITQGVITPPLEDTGEVGQQGPLGDVSDEGETTTPPLY
jgi:hypothetical protein